MLVVAGSNPASPTIGYGEVPYLAVTLFFAGSLLRCMDVRYQEWKPARELAGIVTALWHVTGDHGRMPPSPV